ncbi:MAG: ABC-2 transporter permease [Suipraeoptans sp.]
MKGLLIKDLRYLRINKRFLIIFFFLSFIYMTIFDSLFFFTAFFSAGGMMLSLTTFSYDDFDNGTVFLLSLPFTRKQFVIEKYLFAIGITTLIWAISMVVNTIYLIVTTGDLPSLSFMLPTIAIWFVYLLITSLIIPIQFKFGPEKMGIATMSIFAGFFVIGYFGNKLLQSVGTSLSKIIDDILASSPLVSIVTLLMVCIVCFGISYLITIKIFTKKEF